MLYGFDDEGRNKGQENRVKAEGDEVFRIERRRNATHQDIIAETGAAGWYTGDEK